MNRLITWFVHNSVAANLLMAALLVGGILVVPGIRQEEFPTIELDIVQVTVPYLGAAPEEVEEGVCLRIEEELDGTVGIDRLTATASEGVCSVTIELIAGTDTVWALGEVESRVNSIDTFPVETEKPLVSLLMTRQGVLTIAVSGDVPEATLKELGESLRQEIVELPGVSQVGLEFARPYEISIEIPEQQLRRHGLTLRQVAAAVRNSSLDMPGGSLRTKEGEILLRSKGLAYSGEEFESIVVLTRGDGTSITVGDIGTVVDGFRDEELRATFDGSPAVMVQVSQVGEEDILAIASEVKAYVERIRPQMPEGITLTIWDDRSNDLGVRLSTTLMVAAGGLVLVLLVLTLFLQFRLAIWVALGIPVSVLGTLIFFVPLGMTINSLTLIGFILVLGILVDDGIVIAERIYVHQQASDDPTAAAISGAHEVAVPVVFGVLTTIVAFVPLVLLPGRMGGFFSAMGFTVIIALLFSIVEAQLILPTHLDHSKRRHDAAQRHRPAGKRLRDYPVQALDRVSKKLYQPLLARALEWRYLTVSIAVAALIIALGAIASGRIGLQFFPSIERDRIQATLTMPFGTPIETTEAIIERMQVAAEALREEADRELDEDRSVVTTIQSTLGRHGTGFGGPRPADSSPGQAHLGEVALALLPATERDMSTAALVARWRELTGPVPEAVELRFSATGIGAGQAIDVQLAGRDLDELRDAAAEVGEVLAGYDGVFDISDSFRAGKREIKLTILPTAKPLGLTQSDLARQVREAFYGAEVQRIQRGSEDIRVMVRYPEAERRSIGDLEDLRIRTTDGTEVPFSTVARAEYGYGYASIRRTDRRRVVSVIGEVDRSRTSPEEVLASLERTKLPEILARHPGVTYSLEGEQRERVTSLDGLVRGFGIALLVIYALLAIPLRSYLQPFVIMSAIPFGAIGAIVGHVIMGWDLVFFSMLGIVALSGVVVNDSLILVDFVNRKRKEGLELIEAVRLAGATRFRAIVLTSLTTLVGLLPLIFNRNPIIFPLVPISISLGFGIVFATVITLVLVPCAYVVLEDLRPRPRPVAEAERDTDQGPVGALPSKG